MDRQRETRDRLEQTYLKFWISLADHELGDHRYESVLVSGAAVLGWDAVGKRWKSAVDYPPTLSGIMASFRMLVVYYAH